MTDAKSPDPVLQSIFHAVASGRDGDGGQSRDQLQRLWATIGCAGDPLHRCTLAHHLADMFDDPALALTWDIRALDAADAMTGDRVREQFPALDIAAFYPSLHLNLADDYRRLRSFATAAEHIKAASDRSSSLACDSYGDLIRAAIGEVAEAIARNDASPR